MIYRFELYEDIVFVGIQDIEAESEKDAFDGLERELAETGNVTLEYELLEVLDEEGDTHHD